MKQVRVKIDLILTISDDIQSAKDVLEEIKYQVSKVRDVLGFAEVTSDISLTGDIFIPHSDDDAEGDYASIDGAYIN